MKISIISPYALPEKGACVMRVESFKDFLRSKNYSVEIFAPSRASVSSAGSVFRYKGIFALMKMVFSSDSDLVIATSPPMTHSFFAILAAKLKGKPVILDMRDPWIRAAKAQGLYKRSMKYLVYRAIEKISYLISDKIFVVTNRIGQDVLLDCPSCKNKISLIPNGSTPCYFAFDKVSRNALRDKFNISGKDFVGIYAGAFKDWGLREFIESAKFDANTKIILFLPCSENADQKEFAELKEIALKRNLHNKLIFVNASEYALEENYKLFSAADFGIVIVPKGLDYCMPVKVYDYLMNGMPVVAAGEKGSELESFSIKNPGFLSFTADFGRFCRSFADSAGKLSSSRTKISEFAISSVSRESSNKLAFSIIEAILQKRADK